MFHISAAVKASGGRWRGSGLWHAKVQQGAGPLQVWPPGSAAMRHSFLPHFYLAPSHPQKKNHFWHVWNYLQWNNNPSFTLAGMLRCWTTIGTAKRGFKDKCYSILQPRHPPPPPPAISVWLQRRYEVMDWLGLLTYLVDRSNVCCLLHGDFLVRAWGWRGEGRRDLHRDPRISMASVSGKLDYNSPTGGVTEEGGRQEV